jgi:hypothetical protein
MQPHLTDIERGLTLNRYGVNPKVKMRMRLTYYYRFCAG